MPSPHLSLLKNISPACVLAVSLHAADIVTLNNSDRLTGEIQKLEAGKLSLKTLYAGTVTLDWSMVRRVVSDQPYQVEMKDGLELVGVLGDADNGIAIAGLNTTTTVLPPQIAAIRELPEEATFWDHLSGTVDFGYSLTRGNSPLNQSSIALRSDYRRPSYRIHFDLISLFSKQFQAPTNSDHMASIRWDYNLSERAFTFVVSTFQRNDRERLNLRANVGGGLGWRLVSSNQTELALAGGATYVDEHFRLDETVETPRRSSGEALLGINLERAQLSRVRLLSSMTLHPNLLQRGRYRITAESGLQIPVTGRLSWNLRLFDRFDSRPPVRVLRNEYGIISSFGLAF